MSSREEIAELLSDYAWAMDAGDFEALNEVFTREASFSIEIPGSETIGPFTPRQAIVEFIASTVTDLQDQRRHVVSNQRFEREGEDDADVTATLTLNVIADGKLTVQATGIYRVAVKRESDRWRIANLVIDLDLPF